jgi:hypothetical protein
MKATVTQGIRVVHDGTVYQGGQSVDVPDSVAAFRLECGWASEGSGARALPDPRGLTNTGPQPQSEMRDPRTAPRSRRNTGGK